MVLVREEESELLCVVVDIFDLLELQGDPVAGEGWLCRWEDLLLNLVDGLLQLAGAVLCGVIVASCSCGGSGNGTVEESVGGAGLCWSLSRVLAELLG